MSNTKIKFNPSDLALDSEFRTNPDAESQGKWVRFGSRLELRIGRAGGANTKFAQAAAALSRRYGRAIANDSLKPEQLQAIMLEPFLSSVLFGWRTQINADDDHPEYIDQVFLWDPDDPDKKEPTGYPFTKENARKVFRALPDLFSDALTQASKKESFLADSGDAVVKN